MKIKNIYCFGDSWGVGKELNFDQGEKNFVDILGDKFCYNVKNFSKSNMSLGLITRRLSQLAKEISKDDIVLIVIPPDSRWYTEWKTMAYDNSLHFYHDKTDDWFRYHHQLFIFTICQILDKIECQYLLMHNYGEFPLAESEYYFSKFHEDKFLNQKSLTAILTGSINDNISPIQIESCSPTQVFYGPYFEGNESHPNQKGHIKIAGLVESKIQF